MDLISEGSGHIQQLIRKRNELFNEADLARFGGCDSDEGRFDVVLGKLSYRLTEYPEEIKWLERALELKKKGNDAFQAAQWFSALKFYSLSYIRCPQDKSERE